MRRQAEGGRGRLETRRPPEFKAVHSVPECLDSKFVQLLLGPYVGAFPGFRRARSMLSRFRRARCRGGLRKIWSLSLDESANGLWCRYPSTGKAGGLQPDALASGSTNAIEDPAHQT